MLEPKQKGNLTELQCITSFYELGYSVSIPYGENSRYDFIADVQGKLLRVQVKTSSISEDKSYIEFSCRSSRSNASGCYNRSYTSKEIDYFATYYDGNCYLIPVSECSTTKKLRFIPPKKGQVVGINFAKDYELQVQLNKIIKHWKTNQ